MYAPDTETPLQAGHPPNAGHGVPSITKDTYANRVLESEENTELKTEAAWISAAQSARTENGITEVKTLAKNSCLASKCVLLSFALISINFNHTGVCVDTMWAIMYFPLLCSSAPSLETSWSALLWLPLSLEQDTQQLEPTTCLINQVRRFDAPSFVFLYPLPCSKHKIWKDMTYIEF